MLNRAKSIRSDQGFSDCESSFHQSQQTVVYESPFDSAKKTVVYGLAKSYEQELMQSSAYQKAQSAAAEELFAKKLELLEEKYELGKRSGCLLLMQYNRIIDILKILIRRET